MLRIEHISKTFNPGTVNEKTALSDLSLHLKPGDFASIIGSNGAGKSTLLGAIAGSFTVDSGSIALDGRDITFTPDHRRSVVIGRLFQDPLRGTAPSMTIEENLALAYTRKASRSFFAVNHRDNAYFRDLLATLGMGLEDRMKTKMGLLSGGQRQAASLLMATVARPKLLLLDEHTAALDPGAAEKVMEITGQIVARDKITTLMITHDMDYALSMGSRTIMLSGGRVVLDLSGPERQAMTAGALAERFYTRPGKRVEAETISAKNENSL